MVDHSTAVIKAEDAARAMGLFDSAVVGYGDDSPQSFGFRFMAKKTKRRGRPPGSKNKVNGRAISKPLGKSVSAMDASQLRAHIDSLESMLAKKVNEQRSFLESKLSELGSYVSAKATGAYRALMPSKAGKRAKAAPKYQSKKDKSVKWSGRGMTPIWMREEMKGTKLKKEDFLIP
jgi:DNA-binding protein H-NS